MRESAAQHRPTSWAPGVLSVLLLALLLAQSAVADTPMPSQQRGTSADTAYQVGQLDQVNLFNGNLTVRLPLGLTYPLGPELSYGLALAYNSNGWDSQRDSCPQLGGHGVVSYNFPVADANANAGFGWHLHLGRLLASEPVPGVPQNWGYLSPDGGQHTFYDSLHPGPEGSLLPSAGAQPGVRFTKDGTYLRLREHPQSSTFCTTPVGFAGSCRTVEFPDGRVHEFHNFGDAVASDWRVTRQRDRFANFLDIRYPSDDLWRLTDSSGRRHLVELADGRVERLLLSAFGGQTAVIDLQYRQQSIDRHAYHPPDCLGVPSAAIEVDLLQRVVLPDGSFLEFDYFTSGGPGEVLSGALAELRLPTGGGFRWTYQGIDFRAQAPQVPGGAEQSQIVYGIRSKEVFSDLQRPADAVWRYDYETVGNPSAPGEELFAPCFHTLTLTDPLGNDTQHFFSTANRLGWKFGLPFTACDPTRPGSFSLDGPYLSQRLYAGAVANGAVLRSVWVDYASDGANTGQHQDRNYRLNYRKVVYHDDDGRYKEVTYSDFDGLGNFRIATTGGNFGSGDQKTTTTAYNPGRGSYRLLSEFPVVVDATTDLEIPLADQPWLLQLYDQRRVAEGSRVQVTEQCLDPATGFLLRLRQLAGDRQASHDVITEFRSEMVGPRATGWPARELTYGGDDQAQLASGSLCQLRLPQRPRYERRQKYQFGARARVSAIDSSTGGEVLVLEDQQIDRSSGLPALLRDSAGVETELVWDALGRQLAEREEDGVWTSYEYRLPTVERPLLQPWLTIRDCRPGLSTCENADQLGWRRHRFDGLGRPVMEEVRIPEDNDIVIHSRQLTFNPMGWKLGESAWDQPDLVTAYSAYDRFGRVGRVKPPASPAMRFTYRGDRLKTTEHQVMLPGNSQQPSFTTRQFDRQGRLVEVCEGDDQPWQGACGRGVKTRYGWDAGRHLSWVCSAAQGQDCAQRRDFVYDGRGFLVADRQPEVGPSGNGWTTFAYDAKGHILGRRIEAASQLDLSWTYDSAGRLLKVEGVAADGSARPLKGWRYGGQNGSGDLRRGKLIEASRYNWLSDSDPVASPLAGSLLATVIETYVYGGRGGRMSSRRTRYVGTRMEVEFELGLHYDELGLPATLDYPACTLGCSEVAPARRLEIRRLLGFSRQIPGFADSISYQSGGMVRRVAHANGVAWTLEVDPNNGLRRPSRIATDRGWDTGTYDYDGMGNIHRIGSRTFRYDRLGRLLSGQARAASGDRHQNFSYDDFGNLTQMVTDGVELRLEVDPSSNRLAGAETRYDAAGNMTERALTPEATPAVAHKVRYSFDALGMLRQELADSGGLRWHVYGIDDERLLSVDCQHGSFSSCLAGGRQTWSLRGKDSEVLRVLDFQPSASGGRWRWQQDYVYRDQQLLAAVENDGRGGEATYHLHIDHLGTPRQITDRWGRTVSEHAFLPFGEQTLGAEDGGFSLRFTGHERDQGVLQLDYMHARFCSSDLGRFLSVDPVAGDPATPQSWNRYAYARNNPLRYIDPNGRDTAQVYLDQEVLDFLEKGDDPGFLDPTLQAAAALGVTLITPGPDELLLGAALKGALNGARAGGAVARGGAALKRVAARVKKGDKASDAKSAANAQRLRKDLANRQQVGELRSNAEAYAGAGTKTPIRDADRLVRQHGGHADDWAKVRSSPHKGADGRTYEVHAYKNVRTGEIVEMRTAIH